MQVKSLVVTALFAAVIAVLSQIAFPNPLNPQVPITGQTFGVFLAGALLGSRLGALSLLIYLLLGLTGVPVFAQLTAGPGVLLGPTGGYLLGFVICAFIVGFFVERLPKIRYWQLVLVMVLGNLPVYLVGTAWLAQILGLTFPQGLLIGVVPYLPLDFAKLLLAAGVAIKVRQALIDARLLPEVKKASS